MHWISLIIVTFVGMSICHPTEPLSESHTTSDVRRVKRRYYVCPPDFIRLGNNCYFLSNFASTWQQAHYECKDRQSTLTTLEKANEDRHLRSYLNRPDLERKERWIDGIYDWHRKQWKWGSVGRPIVYHGFSRRNPNATAEELKWQCVTMEPLMNYKWSSKSCVEYKYFICQTRLHKVTKNGRKVLREKWNLSNSNKKINQISVPKQFSENAEVHPRKPGKLKNKENRTNGNGNETTNLKIHLPKGQRFREKIDPNAIQSVLVLNNDRDSTTDSNDLNNAFGHRNVSNEVTRRRRKNNGKGRKNRCKKLLSQTENLTLTAEQIECKRILNKRRTGLKKKRKEKNPDTKFEHITMRTYLMEPRVSELHPKPILEVHDF